MNRLKIEGLHRCRISIGWIGEGDSNVQFVTLVPVKAAISIAIDQVASRDAVRLNHCEDHSVQGFPTCSSHVRGWFSHYQTFRFRSCRL